MTLNELRSIRAPRGKAKLKADLLEELKTLESMSWHHAILASCNPGSTYQGQYPETIGVVRDKHLDLIEETKKKFLKEMQK